MFAVLIAAIVLLAAPIIINAFRALTGR